MFSKILVANRGEVAVRVIRACREMGIETVAVYSAADEGALHTALAEERLCIGPARAADSYLNKENLVAAALATGAQAVHPGYGFLSEDGDFARLCQKHGLAFIGPPPEVIDRVGDKYRAKALMAAAGIPVALGSEPVADAREARRAAAELGFPLLIKAVAGGGGRGIRLVESEEALEAALKAAAAEAKGAFGNGGLILEKYLTGVRHVEVQVLADAHGGVACLGERDCSLQIRRQKVIEETPSPAVTPELRQRLERAAEKAVRAAGYTNAGTVEFLLDGDGDFRFIEMNPRLQVEHGISEEVSGVDIVKWQIRVACGLPLSEELAAGPLLRGCAIECRINAKGAGTVEFLHAPGCSRVHFATALTQGCTVPAQYDPLLGKLVVYAPTRPEAVRKMEAALCELVIEGVPTNIGEQLAVVRSEAFQSGRYHTGTLQESERNRLQ